MTPKTTGAAELPEALRLADLLLALQTHLGPRRDEKDPDEQAAWDGYTDAAAELRRLHAENEALRAQPVGAATPAAPAPGVPSDAQILAVAADSGLGEFVSRTSRYELGNQLLHFGRKLLAAAPQPPAAAQEPDEGVTKDDWVEQAMRVYRIAGDTEDQARECAEYLWGELDMDDLADPYDAAMSDVEGRGPAPQPAVTAGAVDALDAARWRAWANAMVEACNHSGSEEPPFLEALGNAIGDAEPPITLDQLNAWTDAALAAQREVKP